MLVSLSHVLNDAKKNGYAVGAFNCPNLESIRAVISAAEELNVPVILSHAEVHNNMIALLEIGPIMLDYARKSKTSICIHFDHGASFDMCMKAMQLGFTSIMYDASAKSFEENKKETKEIVKIAHAMGVSVEAELGHIFTSSIGGGEGRGEVSASDYDSLDDCYTNPATAKEFVLDTGVDALAIAFGTTHGVYLNKPILDLNRIIEVKNQIDIPLVMHGGSGISDEDFQTAIKNGITKINYFTYMSLAGGIAVTDYIEQLKGKDVFFHDISLIATDAMKENAKKTIRVFSGIS